MRYGWLIIGLLLIPSALYLSKQSDLPGFCGFHDDCVYWVTAKSIADGEGYRIASLPDDVAQTKYPPVYPMLLSLAWRIAPSFPENLRIAAWNNWVALPLLLIGYAAYLPRLGIAKGWMAVLALALVALNPNTIWFAAQLLSEPWFVAGMLGVFVLVEKGWAVRAGLLAAIVFLTRTAGIALLPAVAFWIWRERKDAKGAIRFAAAMTPAVIAWIWWSAVYRAPVNDPAWLYYVDYLGYQRANVGFDNLLVVLWKNTDAFLWSLGSFVIPKMSDSQVAKIATQVVGVAMIAGCVRLAREGSARLYGIFALIYAAMLIGWHYPPEERFLYPLFPLAVAGLLREGRAFVTMLRAAWAKRGSERAVAAGMMAGVALGAAGALVAHAYAVLVVLPEKSQAYRDRAADQHAAARWIRENADPQIAWLADADGLLYLRTGRRAFRRAFVPRLWYAEDREGMVAEWKGADEFARAHGLGYLYWSPEDFSWPVTQEELARISAAHRTNPNIEQIYQNATVTLYRVRSYRARY